MDVELPPPGVSRRCGNQSTRARVRATGRERTRKGDMPVCGANANGRHQKAAEAQQKANEKGNKHGNWCMACQKPQWRAACACVNPCVLCYARMHAVPAAFDAPSAVRGATVELVCGRPAMTWW
eukprot:350683-Chlamydomonas_euryale.AAC.2